MRCIIQVSSSYEVNEKRLYSLLTIFKNTGLSLTVVNKEFLTLDSCTVQEKLTIDNVHSYQAISIIGDNNPLTADEESLDLIEIIQNFDATQLPIAGLGNGLIPIARAGALVGKWTSGVDSSDLAAYLKGYGALIGAEPVVQSGWIVSASNSNHINKYAQVFASLIAKSSTRNIG